MTTELVNNSTIKLNSQRYRQQIRNQFKLLSKSNSPSKLISLVQEFQLDPKCQIIDLELAHYLIIAYIIQGDWLSVKHISKRYQLGDAYPNIIELAGHAINQELMEFTTLFGKVTLKLKEKGKSFIQIDSIDQLFDNAKILFCLRVFSKYYMNFDLKSILQMVGCKEDQIVNLGYKICDGYVQFGEENKKDNNLQGSQQVLLQKMKNLVKVAEQISHFE